ncbi:hypothetical protein BKA70DRAFT_1577178 [Coprinopsis sp. MPI-PUGE-AT-0042]|nr:hypothetical protein BKA70DRAFT_1577178 [Coprinopsis sp. MPI-PUGE-AT-0042]
MGTTQFDGQPVRLSHHPAGNTMKYIVKVLTFTTKPTHTEWDVSAIPLSVGATPGPVACTLNNGVQLCVPVDGTPEPASGEPPIEALALDVDEDRPSKVLRQQVRKNRSVDETFIPRVESCSQPAAVGAIGSVSRNESFNFHSETLGDSVNQGLSNGLDRTLNNNQKTDLNFEVVVPSQAAIAVLYPHIPLPLAPIEGAIASTEGVADEASDVAFEKRGSLGVAVDLPLEIKLHVVVE